MKSATSQIELRSGFSSEKPTLRVFVAFEDARARSQAWQLYRLLAGDLAADMEIQPAFCQFEEITDLENEEDATRAALASDVVLFAMSARAEIGAPLKAWVDGWTDERAVRGGGLLILIEHAVKPSSLPTSNQCELRELARRAGMEFLAETVHPEDRHSGRHQRGARKRGFKRRTSVARHLPALHPER